jgi:predicted Fe-Mo cluster-binding NifX family protein
MKTVITVSGNTSVAKFDRRFGRASWFCLYDDETKETAFYENSYADANNGAGTKAAEKMIEMHVGKVISGDFGPKAKELLGKFNVQMVILHEADLSISAIISKLQ